MILAQQPIISQHAPLVQSLRPRTMPDALKTEIVSDLIKRALAVEQLVAPVDVFAASEGRAWCKSRTPNSGTRCMGLVFRAPAPGSAPRWCVTACPCTAGKDKCRHALQLDCIANLPIVSGHLQQGAKLHVGHDAGKCPWCGAVPAKWGKLALCFAEIEVPGRGFLIIRGCAQCGAEKVV